MLDELLLLSGNDIPFYSGQINIHQPTLNEIAFIGEENFFHAVQLLTFSKNVLSEEDKTNLADIADFDILMSIINDENAAIAKLQITMLLTLLFPEYQIDILDNSITFTKDDDVSCINQENYEEFREIINVAFSLESKSDEDFKPKGEAAAKIAEKLRRGREKVAELKGKPKKINILSKYASILSVGLQMDIKVFLNHTVYQLYDVFKRFQLYQGFDIYIKAKMAGATDLDEADNWMDDIHT